jgi:hypothetical protein
VVDTNQVPELMSIEQLAQRLGIATCATCAASSLKDVCRTSRWVGSSASTPARSRSGSTPSGALR